MRKIHSAVLIPTCKNCVLTSTKNEVKKTRVKLFFWQLYYALTNYISSEAMLFEGCELNIFLIFSTQMRPAIRQTKYMEVLFAILLFA